MEIMSLDHLERLKDLMLSMNKLRIEKDTCDFTIMVENKPIYAHRMVLSACSPYFKAMMKSNFKEAEESQVFMRGLDHASVELLIRFLYTAQIVITDENVEMLFRAADSMEISVTLADTVSSYIIKSCEDEKGDDVIFNPASCICTLFYIADKYSLPKLSDAAKIYIVKNFSKITNEQISKLSIEHLVEIIKSNDLVVVSEVILYEIVLRWSHQNIMWGHLAELMKHIRFSQMDLRSLSRISRDVVIKSDERCRQYLDDAMLFLLSHYNINESLNRDSFYARGASVSLYTFGCSLATKRYDPKKNEWTVTEMAIVRRGQFGIVAWDNVIYFVGGSMYFRHFEERRPSRHVARYNPHSNMTSQETPLPIGKWDLGVAVSGQFLYAIGGRNGRSSYDTVDKYDPTNREWIKCAPLNVAKCEIGVATLGNYIYAVGGWIVEYDEAINSVERYNPQSDQWTPVSSMGRSRSSPGCTVLDGHIYVVGGYDGDEFLSGGERYDPELDRWEPIPPMSSSRNRLSLVVMDGLIYAVGGDHGNPEEGSSDVEVYDPVKKKWSSCSSSKVGCFCRTIAIEGLPN